MQTRSTAQRSRTSALLAALLWMLPLGVARSAPLPLGRVHLQSAAATAQAEPIAYFAGDALETAPHTRGVIALREGTLALAGGSRAILSGQPGAYRLQLARGAAHIQLPPAAIEVEVQGLRLRAAPRAGAAPVPIEVALDAADQLFVRSPASLELLGATGERLAALHAHELAPLCALVPAALGQHTVPCLPDVAGPGRVSTLAARLLGAALASAMIARPPQ